MIQVMFTPQLLAGSLSLPTVLPCNSGQQWLLYDCKPNPITGLGCIVPNTNSKSLTHKTVAVHNTTCQPVNGEEAGERTISWHWQEDGQAGQCITDGATCCNYGGGKCSRLVKYLCVKTGAGDNGERQCTPEYLPVIPDNFDATANNYDIDPISVKIPCRENYCGS
jgi:hypothetical protein